MVGSNIAKETGTETDCWRPLFKVIMMYFTHTHADDSDAGR